MQKLSTLGDVISPSINAYRAGQQRADQVRKQNALAELGAMIQSGTPLRQAAAQGLANGVPLSAFTSISQLGNQDRAYGRQVQRDAVGDQRFEQQFDFRKERAAAGDVRTDRAFNASQENIRADNERADRLLKLRELDSEFRRREKPSSPLTKLGKLNRDLQQGLITPEQHSVGIASLNAPGLKIGPDGRIVNVGTANTKGVNTALQKQIAGDRVILNDLGSIRKKYNEDGPAFLTFKGRAVSELTAFGEKSQGIPIVENILKPSNKTREFLRARTSFNNEVEQTFNSYRKLITGAAAAVAELDRLQRTFLSGEMSPTQFEAALDVLEEKTARAIQVRQQLVNQGVSLSSKEAKQAIDAAVTGSQAQAQNAIPEGATATNPQTGDKIIFQNGQWIPAQ